MGQSGLYWIVCPDYRQGHQEFSYLWDWFAKWGIIVGKPSNPLEGSRQMDLMGGIHIETRSAEYEERLGSVAPDLIVVVEAGQVSEDTRVWLQGRTLEKGSRIVYTGTLENDDAHKQWAWYIDEGSAWKASPDALHSAFSLPSWANRFIFKDCRFVGHNIPNPLPCDLSGDHGPEHGGALHPQIRHYKELWPSFVFQRRIAGEPAGSPYLVYYQLDEREHDLLRPMPEDTKFVRHVGGIDFGDSPGHLSALVVVGITAENKAWVRECRTTEYLRRNGDIDWLKRNRDDLSHQYNCWLWGADPMEKWIAREWKAEAVSGSAGSRGARSSLVGSRIDYGRLYFDSDGLGVNRLFEEMRRVHKKKLKSGEIVLDRTDDDRTAALEDAIEMADGSRSIELQSFKSIRREPPKRQYQRREVLRV